MRKEERGKRKEERGKRKKKKEKEKRKTHGASKAHNTVAEMIRDG